MTPEEKKAKELFNKFYNIEPVEPIYIGMDRGQAKQCALICVDEIINIGSNPNKPTGISCWKEVKQEINKL